MRGFVRTTFDILCFNLTLFLHISTVVHSYVKDLHIVVPNNTSETVKFFKLKTPQNL